MYISRISFKEWAKFISSISVKTIRNKLSLLWAKGMGRTSGGIVKRPITQRGVCQCDQKLMTAG